LDISPVSSQLASARGYPASDYTTTPRRTEYGSTGLSAVGVSAIPSKSTR